MVPCMVAGMLVHMEVDIVDEMVACMLVGIEADGLTIYYAECFFTACKMSAGEVE